MAAKVEKMFDLAKEMLSNAYCPYSQFAVGCCLLTDKGNYYAGCNVENASYSLTCCAEATAIAQMVAAGETRIVEAVVIAKADKTCAPCGACRQRLQEFASGDMVVHMGTAQGLTLSKTLAELLPLAFDASYLK